jgi:putative inorganic carbon (hco3(-)) transporter
MDTITTTLRDNRTRVLLWLLTIVVALLGGLIAARVSTAYVVGLTVLLLVIAAFIWRSQRPIIPFLLLVAAIQGGVLLTLPLGDAPIQGLLPILGAWALGAALLSGEPNHLRLPASGPGGYLNTWLLGLMAVAALTAVVQDWRPGGQALSLTEVLTAVQLAVLVWLTAYVLSSPRKALLVAYVSIAAGALISLAALLDLAGIINLGTDEAYGDITRVSGLVADPNFFSAQLLISLAFAVQVGIRARNMYGKLLVWISAGLIIGGIVTTYSAGALVGVAAVLGITVLLRLRVSGLRALSAITVIVVIAISAAVFAPATYREAITTKYEGLSAGTFETFGTKRGAAWQAAAREIVANPLMGAGFGSGNMVSAVAEYYTYERVERRAAHNTYLSMGVCTGVIGLALFLAILISCARVLWWAYGRTAHDKRSEAAQAAACLLAGLVVMATQGLQLDLEFEKYLWILVGACVAMRHWPAAAGLSLPFPTDPQEAEDARSRS